MCFLLRRGVTVDRGRESWQQMPRTKRQSSGSHSGFLSPCPGSFCPRAERWSGVQGPSPASPGAPSSPAVRPTQAENPAKGTELLTDPEGLYVPKKAGGEKQVCREEEGEEQAGWPRAPVGGMGATSQPESGQTQGHQRPQCRCHLEDKSTTAGFTPLTKPTLPRRHSSQVS